MKKLFIAICLPMILLIAGCNKKININLNDYRPLEDYDFQEQDFLMRKGQEEKDILGGIYSLKGLSPDKYVGHVQYWLIPGRPTKTLYANFNTEEPIACLDPCKILLSFDDKTFTIEDHHLVEQLVNSRRKCGIQTSAYPDVYPDRRIYMGFVFDVPSDLEWKCHMLLEDDNIKMLWYDNTSKEQYVCDITGILKQYSVIEDVYSLCDK